MNRGKILRVLSVACLAGCLSLIGSSPSGANTEPAFRLADGYPRKVGKSVSALAVLPVDRERQESLGILDPVGHQMKFFENDPAGKLRLSFRRALPESIGGWSVSRFSWSDGGFPFAITNPREQTVTVVEGPHPRTGGSRIMKVADMGRPAAAVIANYSHHNGRVEMPWITVNPETDDLSIHYMDFWEEFWLGDPLPVGDTPVDLGWIWREGLPEQHERLVTVNKGSDDLSLIDMYWPWDREIAPVPTVIQTIPVGDKPVDFEATTRNRFAVVNQGSNSVSILELNEEALLENVAEYPVGSAPTSVATAKLNRDRHRDLVVTNGGSDDLSFLLADGNGGYRPAGTMKVGDHPVDVEQISHDRYFIHDLAVANEGDGTVSILEWLETSGSCKGQPARLVEMPEGEDFLSTGGNPEQLVGGPLDDRIYSGPGNDCLSGKEGEDLLSGDYGADLLRGGPDGDRIIGGAGRDTLAGGPGDDFLCENYMPWLGGQCWAEGFREYLGEGNAAPNVMYGGPGDDTLESGASRDRIFGGPGDDLIISRAKYGPDRIDCGPGRDVARVRTGDRVRRCEVVRRK